jgi:SAM-dependent methyltransferase
MSSFHIESWEHVDYQKEKQTNFKILSDYLKTSPTTLLDIGCGLAWESRLFNEHYDTELWLLDGDSSTNNDGHVYGYHNSSDTFNFYHSMETLDNELKKKGTKNYHLVDANNIKIDPHKKFDLITSWLSCGFHYPCSTYKDLILAHSHDTTKVIVNLRAVKGKVIKEDNIEIVNILHTRDSKCITAEIKFKD